MSNYPLFSVLGIEIEYMLVDTNTLAVVPKSDVILKQIAGSTVNEVEMGEIALSNELVMHVIELKNNGPKSPDSPIAHDFQQAILQLQPLLAEHQLQLLPTGAHPWMNPLLETKRWPYGNKDIYETYDTIFNCQGHGWSNLQSMHVNMPYANDEDFSQLHNTIRLILPLLPALAASTPFLDGVPTGVLDSRLEFYANNQKRIPSISGEIIPEFVRTQEDYQTNVLQPMYRDIQPFDPKGILQYEWLNSRAAIPKFNYKAIEIRILDSQECVNADIAIAKVIHAVLKRWHESGSRVYVDKIYSTKNLKSVYNEAIKKGMSVEIDDVELLEQWHLPKKKGMNLVDIWSFLIESVSCDLDLVSQRALEHILSHGNVSERLLRACGKDVSRANLSAIYRQLGDCLLSNKQFSV